jgi:uncharacterized protein YecE (DUF72 family)
MERTRVLIGTSGFSYPAWRGGFYPEKMPPAKMLAYYAERLAAVEINNTFYRMPTAEVLQRWSEETPAGFRFALKSPRQITHDKRLVEVGAAVDRLAEVARALGEKLGPVLFQLPPNQRKDLPRLDSFLAALPAGLQGALEFRHASWFSDDVYDCLRTRRAALCLAESDELETPLEATADWGYLRLRRLDYDQAAIARWASYLQARSWSEAYVFFKHEDAGKGPDAANRLRLALEEVSK